MASKSWTREIIIGVVTLLVIAGVIGGIMLPNYVEDTRKTAYERGVYDQAYKTLEDEWSDSRATLVHATLALAVCDAYSIQPNCDLLAGSRDQLLLNTMPEKIEDGDIGEYQRATHRAESSIRQLRGARETLDRRITLVEEWSTDPEVYELIDTVAREAQSARSSLFLAELELVADADNSGVRDAKQALEDVFAQYEAEDFPTDWDMEELERAHEELSDAVRALDELVLFD